MSPQENYITSSPIAQFSDESDVGDWRKVSLGSDTTGETKVKNRREIETLHFGQLRLWFIRTCRNYIRLHWDLCSKQLTRRHLIPFKRTRKTEEEEDEIAAKTRTSISDAI